MGAERLKIVRIHLLRQHGYEGAEETIAVRHRVGAAKSLADVGIGIAFPFEGKVGRSEAESRMRCLKSSL